MKLVMEQQTISKNDSWYSGFFGNGSYFVTRLNFDTIFKLDEIGTKDRAVDVKKIIVRYFSDED